MIGRHSVYWRFVSLSAIVAAAAVAAAVAPAAHAASCATRTLNQTFAAFGDGNEYFVAPGGSFESGTPGWTLSNAAAISGNDPYHLNSASGMRSLKLNGSGSATSPGFCITRDDPSLRFAARTVTSAASTGNYSQLNVSIVVRNPAGSQATYFLGAITPQGNGGWFLLPPIQYGSLFDSYLFGPDGSGTGTMQIQFNVQGQGGTWYVDDVFVDPFAGK